MIGRPGAFIARSPWIPRAYASSATARAREWKKRSVQMPDLSHPKWKRREKLNPINFANKGKSGFRQVQTAFIEEYMFHWIFITMPN
jgi:hypothetical protein